MTTGSKKEECRSPLLFTDNPNIRISNKTIESFCRKSRVCEFRFYGSVIRNDFRPDSDIDVMVEFCPDTKITFFSLAEMQREPEEFFERKVDLADRGSVEQSKNYIRKRGMLSGTPPVLRQMSYLLDMLLCTEDSRNFTGGKNTDTAFKDQVTFHALSLASGSW